MRKCDNAHTTMKRHNRWTIEDDNKLKMLTSGSQEPNWKQIALYFPERNIRQCKERWKNYLSPNVNNGVWSKEEDDLLLKKYNELGPKWKQLCPYFEHRTNVNIKNRFLYLMRAWKQGKKIKSLGDINAIDANHEISNEATKNDNMNHADIHEKQQFQNSYHIFNDMFTEFTEN